MFNAIGYSDTESERKETGDISEVSELRKNYPAVWVDIVSPTNEELSALGESFGFHKLALEDCSHTTQRAKVDDYGDYFFLIIKAMEYKVKASSYQIAMFVGKDYIVSVRERDNPKHVAPLLENIASRKHNNSRNGPDYLCYLLTDTVIDEYFPILDQIDDEIEDIEDEVISHAPKYVINKIMKLKRDLLVMRKVLFPTMETIVCLQRGNMVHMNKKTMLYFADIYDHIVEVIDLLETSRELISSAIDIYMSRTQNIINEVAKTFAMVSILLMWPTVIGAIYGMNFKEIPELEWGLYGYVFSLVLMGLTMAGTIIYFKKKRWV